MTVNPIYINYVFSPLIGGADLEDEIIKFSFFDPDKHEDQVMLVKAFLLPEFQKQNPALKKEIKNSLAYYLCTQKLDFESVLDSLLLPIKTPKDSRKFLELIWDIFFPDENRAEIINREQIVEDHDINAPFKLLSRSN